LRKLRARSLSVQEARTVLGGQGLIRKQADDILAEMVRLGYLDDRVLAEQLVHAGQDRRGQGRQAIAQTLAKRGVPRDVADAALAELPDDDMERALEFARRKAGGIGGRDAHAELRRLAGQLARRGYPSNVALSAARQALDER
jgi:regulatory protein